MIFVRAKTMVRKSNQEKNQKNMKQNNLRSTTLQ